jgi:hypothetical protein
MDKIKDGGPAFPSVVEQVLDATGADFTGVIDRGMTLRDWFAGQVIAGQAAFEGVGPKADHEHFAKMAYAMADAMLSARERSTP